MCVIQPFTLLENVAFALMQFFKVEGVIGAPDGKDFYAFTD